MCGEQSQPHLNKAEDNDRPRADYFWLRLGSGAGGGKEQHLTCEPGRWEEGGGGVGSDGVRAHLSAEPNNTMATAERRDEMNDGQREGYPGGGRWRAGRGGVGGGGEVSPCSDLPDTADSGTRSLCRNCFSKASC